MKKIILLSTITAMMLCLTSCGKKCAVCGDRDDDYEIVSGEYVCSYCYDDIEKCAVCGEKNIYGNEEVMGMTVCKDCWDAARKEVSNMY